MHAHMHARTHARGLKCPNAKKSESIAASCVCKLGTFHLLLGHTNGFVITGTFDRLHRYWAIQVRCNLNVGPDLLGAVESFFSSNTTSMQHAYKHVYKHIYATCL